MKNFASFGMALLIGALCWPAWVHAVGNETVPVTGAAATSSPTASSPALATPVPTADLGKTLGLQFSGDLRFRFFYMVQNQDYGPTYASNSAVSYIDHQLNYRLRASFGVEKDFGQEAHAGLRIITSGDGDPADPYWNISGAGTFKEIGLDQAYLRFTPRFLDQKVTLTLGKFENPLNYSPLTWDEDVMPEGIALDLRPAPDTRFTVLYFRLQDNPSNPTENAGSDPFMANLQLQQKFKLSDAEVGLTAGYQYVSNVYSFETGDAAVSQWLLNNPANPPGAPLSITQKGMVGDFSNSDIIPEMHVVEGILNVSHTLGEEKIPVLWTLHGAYNLSAFNLTPQTNMAVSLANPNSNASNALALYAGVHVGKVARGGDWAGGFEWGYIEPDAVFSAFNGPNEGLGHNNNTWVMGNLQIGLWDGLNFEASNYLDWRVNYDVFGPTPLNLIGTTSHLPIMSTLLDLTAKL